MLTMDGMIVFRSWPQCVKCHLCTKWWLHSVIISWQNHQNVGSVNRVCNLLVFFCSCG